MKVLHLTYNEYVETRSKWGSEYINVAGIYKIGVKITKLFRLFPFLKYPFFMKLFLGEWKKNIGEFDTILLWADRTAPALCNTIHSITPKIRIIAYYVNCCALEVSPDAFDTSICELWSFDPEDCRKYNLRYNPPFTIYFNGVESDNYTLFVKNDIYFLGRDKGRLQDLIELQRKFENLGLKCSFHIVESRESKFKENKKYFSDFISYSKSIEQIKASKAILDWNVEKQAGITQRPLESIYLRKKLITNNIYIRKYDFYNKNNVFIIGIDDFSKLKEFLDSPYQELSKEIVDNYTVNAWITRFYK